MTKGRPKLSQAESEARKLKIISTAKRLFIEDGYQSVSMRKIASEVGLSPMMLYKSVENKRDLLRFIWTDIFIEVSKQCQEAIIRHHDDRAKLEAFSATFLRYWLDHPEHYRVVYLESDQLESAEDRYFADEAIIGELFEVLSQLAYALSKNKREIETKIKLLVLQLQGIAHGLITIEEIPWGTPDSLLNQCLIGFYATLD